MGQILCVKKVPFRKSGHICCVPNYSLNIQKSASPSSTVNVPLYNMLNALAIKQLTVLDTLVPNTIHYACIYNLVLNVYILCKQSKPTINSVILVYLSTSIWPFGGLP